MSRWGWFVSFDKGSIRGHGQDARDTKLKIASLRY